MSESFALAKAAAATGGPEFLAGGRRLLKEYLNIDSNKRALVVIDPLVEDTVADLLKVGRREGLEITAVHADMKFEDLEQLFKAHDVIAFLERNTSHYRPELSEYISSHKDSDRSFYRVFDFSPELLTSAFRVTREQLKRLNSNLINRGRETAVVTITSVIGTDLKIQLDEKFGWINSYGEFDGVHPGVLPPSEVATFSPHVNGFLVADGAINTNFGFPFDPRLATNPVEIELRESRVKDISCESPIIALVLKQFLRLANSDRVGEVGFGTNIGLTQFVPFVSHINERFPALHIGLGSNNQGLSRVPWACSLHLDLILGPCDIYFDDTAIMRDGRYVVPELEGLDVAENPNDMGFVDTF